MFDCIKQSAADRNPQAHKRPGENVVWLGVVVFGALGVRLLFAFVPGYLDDTRAWAVLAAYAVHYQFFHAYALVRQVPWIGTYPPLYYAFLQGAGLVYQAFFASDFIPGSFGMNLTLKLVPILGDCLLGLVIYQAARELRGRAYALGALLYFSFNLAIIYNTAYWGMFGDSLYTLFIVAALWMITRKQWAAAAVCAVIAVHLKPQALFFVPLIAAAILVPFEGRKWLGTVLAGGITVLLIWLPFLVADTAGEAVQVLGGIASHGSWLTVNAHNLWYLGTQGYTFQSDTASLWGPVTARGLGLAGFAVVNLVAWRTRDSADKTSLFGAAALVGLGAFVFLTQMHENYLYPTVALLAVMWRRSSLYTAIALALTFTSLVNMAMHDYFFPGWRWLSRVPFFAMRMGNSILNLVVFFGWSVLLLFKRPLLVPSRVDHDPIL